MFEKLSNKNGKVRNEPPFALVSQSVFKTGVTKKKKKKISRHELHFNRRELHKTNTGEKEEIFSI